MLCHWLLGYAIGPMARQGYDLQLTWYDEEGRWVKLRCRAKDGSMIDYICRQCQAPTTITEAE